MPIINVGYANIKTPLYEWKFESSWQITITLLQGLVVRWKHFSYALYRFVMTFAKDGFVS